MLIKCISWRIFCRHLSNRNLIIVDESLQRPFARMKESDVDFRPQIRQSITATVVKIWRVRLVDCLGASAGVEHVSYSIHYRIFSYMYTKYSKFDMFCFALTLETLLDLDTTIAPTLPPTTTDAPTLPPTTTAPPGIVKRLHVYLKDQYKWILPIILNWRKSYFTVDCVLSVWGSWSTCTKSCGTGTTVRRRKIEVGPENGGEECQETKEMIECNTDLCPGW